MGKIVGVRFKPAGKIYDFSCGAFVLDLGDAVIVKTEQGLGFGFVATAPESDKDRQSDTPLKKVYRLAGEEDFAQRENNQKTEADAKEYCIQCVKKLALRMNLFSVESTFDAGKLTFYFTAEGRVDFRELIKMLLKEFRVRIEMRQVGIRNQAKMCGGLGRCGRVTCCSSFINNFEPVSIKMAKEQGLSLNPTKISGLCGRLMCCLTFENNTYKNEKKNMPPMGRRVTTDKGKGKVIRQNILQRSVTVRLEDGSEADFKASEIS